MLFIFFQLPVLAKLLIRQESNPVCNSGTSIGTFILDSPNRTSILLVSQPFIIKWHYTPPVKNPPKSLDIKLQLIQDGITYSWNTIIVKNLNISNGATAFNWTVQPLNGKYNANSLDGEYKIRLVPDGKETFNVKNDQLPCFEDGEAKVPLATSKDLLPPNFSLGERLKILSEFIVLVFLSAIL